MKYAKYARRVNLAGVIVVLAAMLLLSLNTRTFFPIDAIYKYTMLQTGD